LKIDLQTESNFKKLKTRFNPTQEFCIKSMLSSKRKISLLHGPPGTGKTHTLVGCLNLLILGRNQREKQELESGEIAVRRKRKILVCAASNRALDEVLIRLTINPDFDSKSTKIVRLGFCDDYSDPLVSKYTLESQSLDLVIRQKKRDQTDNYLYASISAGVEKQKSLMQSIKNLNESIKALEDSGYDKSNHDWRLLREKRNDLSSQLLRIRNDIN
jgi:AAA domain